MNKINIVYLTSIFVFTNLPLESIQRSSQRIIPEDATLNFNQLAEKYIRPSEEYNVMTEDEYILKLFRIPSKGGNVVLLMHGILDSADSFMIRGRRSLAATLVAEGYDVWVANCRGSKYSRQHRHLNPDRDNSYWDFSLHEIGLYDLPAFIDFIILKTGVKKINAIGHSQGNMVFYVLGSLKPEYNDKVNVLIALGPVGYLNKNNLATPLKALVYFGPFLNKFLQAINMDEIFGDTSYLTYFRNNICTNKMIGYKICAEMVFFNLAGEDTEEFEYDFFFNLIGHYPTSTSRKNAMHLLQIAEEEEFMQYDYGSEKNFQIYGQAKPPVYDLRNVNMGVALFVGKNDRITPIVNVEILRKQLPNVVKYKIMDWEKYNHIDHVWGRNMDKYLFPDVLEVLSYFN